MTRITAYLPCMSYLIFAISPAAAGRPALEIDTGEPVLNEAIALARRTLEHNVSEKWGTICPVVAPAWSKNYPAWIHPFDNFWMNKVTVHIFDKKSVAWPVQLLAAYQSPTGMIGWGIHDCPSPEAVQDHFARMSPEELQKSARASRYIRDHLFIMQVHDLWMATGDRELLEELLPHCRSSIEYLFTIKDSDGDGLVESADIIEDVDVAADGQPSGPNDAERFVDQCLTYGALLNFARMCVAVDDLEAAEEARKRAARIRHLADELYWSDEGYYIFAVDTETNEPLHPGHTSTYANGYAILFGLADKAKTTAILDWSERRPFKVPGPILIPPLPDDFTHGGKTPSFPPGVYVNGGCGWGRGHLPSLTLANFRHGRRAVAIRHLRGMAEAATEAGAFYEYWTWKEYTGRTEPGGCKDYSETTSAFLDAVIHGLFGIEPLQPGFRTVRIAPRFPASWQQASISLPIPGRPPLHYSYRKANTTIEIILTSGCRRDVKLSVYVPGGSPERVTVNQKRIDFDIIPQDDARLCEFAIQAVQRSTVRIEW